MDLWQYLFLFALGLAAGVANVMAGGGSLVTMPAMIFLGMTPAAANGTNRVALLVQSVSAATTFKKKGFSDFSLSLSLAACTLPGVILGSYAAVAIDPAWFKRLLAAAMVLSLAMILRRPGSRREKGERTPHRLLAHLAMGAVGFYGGFMQAGVGFLLMAVLHAVLALDLVRVNMHKVFIVGVYMVPSLLVFVLTGNVEWIAGCALAAGNGLGGWLGARFSIAGGERTIRIVFTVAVAAMAVKLVWP